MNNTQAYNAQIVDENEETNVFVMSIHPYATGSSGLIPLMFSKVFQPETTFWCYHSRPFLHRLPWHAQWKTNISAHVHKSF